MVHGKNSDKGCAAKTAIAEALAAMEYGEPEPFLRGVRHVQREPVWGGTEDTAGRLRAACILGLMGTGYPDAAREAVDLLADPQPDARAAARYWPCASKRGWETPTRRSRASASRRCWRSTRRIRASW